MLTLTKMTPTTFQRKLSPVERLFIIVADTDPPFCNQMIIEGTGRLEESDVRKAVEKVCEANPGSRLVLKGRSLWGKWVDSGAPAPVRTVDGSQWSGYDGRGAPFLFEPMPFRTSHTCEVLLVEGSPFRLLFRTLHATMDGAGTLHWGNEIFRALRNEPLIGSYSPLSDKEYVDLLNLPGNEVPSYAGCLAPTGLPEGQDFGFDWKRVTLKGKFSKLLPRVALVLAKEARKQGAGKVSFSVPLDLRRLKNALDVDSTANLTRRILLDVAPDDTIESLTQQLIYKHENLTGDPKFATLLGYTPSWLVKRAVMARRKGDQKNRVFTDSGTISNGGKLPVDNFYCDGFQFKGFFWVPPQVSTKPFFLSVIGYGDNVVEFVFSMPKMLGSNGRLDKVVDIVISEFQS